MHVHEQPVAVLGRQDLRRHHERVDAVDRHRFGLDAEALAQRRQVRVRRTAPTTSSIRRRSLATVFQLPAGGAPASACICGLTVVGTGMVRAGTDAGLWLKWSEC